AVAISDFHSTVIVAKRIHDNNIIAISIENLKKKNNNAISQVIFNFVYCILSLLLANELHSKYKCREVERVCNQNCTKATKRVIPP
ncbi:hypothetical protein LDENG_00059470, partial [Lucifuga dentata]